jgi:hypothetical protein
MTEMDIQSFFYLIKKSSEELGNFIVYVGYLILEYEENEED